MTGSDSGAAAGSAAGPGLPSPAGPRLPLPAGLRFALGMLSVLPVRVDRVDRAVARAAMLWAPVAGALIGALQSGVLAALLWATGDGLVAAAAAVTAGALLTRALHLDGLADVADGLGSGRPPAEALDIMKRSDIGPFGVVALVLTVLLQVAALTSAARHGVAEAGLSIVVAAACGRLVLPWACRRGVPAARPQGLGTLVAGTVPAAGAIAVTAPALVVGTVMGALVIGGFAGTIGVPAAAVIALVTALSFLRHLLRRLGGVTGDVLGALVEITTTVALLVMAVATRT